MLDIPHLISPNNYNIGQSISGYLLWYPVDGATYYNVQLSNNSSFIYPIINKFLISNPSLTYSNLESYGKYYWKVKAYNDKDSSDWSFVWNFTTLLAPPKLLWCQ